MSVRAQVQDSLDRSRSSPRWHLLLEGEPTPWPESSPSAPLDSIRSVGRRVLHQLRRNGYYYARLDSATVDTSSPRPVVRLYAHRGPQVEVETLRIEGAEAVSPDALRRLMDTKEGAVLDSSQFERDLQALLDRYEEAGYPLAQIRVADLTMTSGASPGLRLTLKVTEGPMLWLKRVDVPEEARTSPQFLAHLAGLSVGEPLTGYDPERIQEELRAAEFFQDVGTPKLQVEPDGGAVVFVPLDERSPGSFNLALGYLPPSNSQGTGQLVGSGNLTLVHLFGGGRRANFTLDRRPGRASVFDVTLADPYIFGMPVRLQGRFRGEQRDSTYGKRVYRVEGGYRVGGGVEGTVRLSREVVRPGPAGRRLRDGRQDISRSHALFYGIGLRYEAVRRRINPRRGLLVDVQVEQGQKQRRRRRLGAEGDTLRVRQSLRQERLQATTRFYIPLLRRQVVVIGGDGSVLLSDEYDRSDLFRFGGAESLRGYDEDRFLGNVTVRGLVEYRLQLGRRTYAYGFGDLGYVERPALGTSAAITGWHPGYGLGIQLGTGLGILTTTYALNPEVRSPLDGRIHFGLSVDL